MRGEEGEVAGHAELRLRRSWASTIFLLAVGVLLAYLCYQLARPFMTAIIWALILAVIFSPVHRDLRAGLKNENFSAVVSTLVTMLVGVLPLIWLGTAIAREAQQGYQLLQAHLASEGNLTDTTGRIEWLGPVWEWVQRQLARWEIDTNGLAAQAAQYVGELAVALARGTITNLSAFIVNLVLAGFSLFFFFRDGPRILAKLQRLLPLEMATSGSIYELIGQVIRAAIFGVVVMSLIKGVLAGLAFWALGLHSPALWGAAAAVVSVIPVFGASLVWGPAVVVLWAQGHAIKALILAIWGLTALSLIDNFLYPLLVGTRVRLHTLVVFFSTLGGVGYFGFLGFFLGPIIATLMLALIEVASEYYRAPQSPPETPPAPPSDASEQVEVNVQ